MAGWWGDGEWGGCVGGLLGRENCYDWHVRGGGREPKCGMSAHGVSGALGARG